jgi:probable addiction module antidote protein
MKTVKTEKKIKVSELAEFDITRHLKSKRAMTEYLNQVIADGDDAELAAALGHIARAKGMAEISKSSGITREVLYKALKPNTKPRFNTVSKVLGALGMRITIHA